MEVLMILFGISLILFFGAFSEFLFKKTGIPDILFLIILGFILGPFVLGYANPASFAGIAPLFTTFALLFLLFDGAFSIDLSSLAKGVLKSLQITLFNFLLSMALITIVLVLAGFDFFTALLAGVILGEISSAFVIPLLKQLNIQGKAYSVLALESAFTDVLCIVMALAVVEAVKINAFNFQVLASNLLILFSVAAAIGIVAGIFWIFLVQKVFKESKHYLITIAYLILVFVIAESLNGNGVIAGLCLGLVLRNSKQLTSLFSEIVNPKIDRQKAVNGDYGVAAVSQNEEFFYAQISFFLKTFFFVYIGILINLSDYFILALGLIIAIILMFARRLSMIFAKDFTSFEQKIVGSVFARGLAAAAIAQILVIEGVPHSDQIASITYAVITFSIILSSISIFVAKKTRSHEDEIISREILAATNNKN